MSRENQNNVDSSGAFPRSFNRLLCVDKARNGINPIHRGTLTMFGILIDLNLEYGIV